MRILLADHQVQLRNALTSLLARYPVFEIAGEVSRSVDLERSVEQSLPDVILLDLSLPGLEAGAVLPKFKQSNPNLIVIGMGSNSNEQTQGLYPGLDAYITKREPADKLLKLLRKYAHTFHASANEKV